MEKSIRVLAVLLGVQVVLALALWSRATNLSAKTDANPLLDLGGKTVERLTIEGPDRAEVLLAREKNTWRLPEQGDFPADRARIESLLARLKNLRQGPPVADTEAAQKRFKVSDGNFLRRITLASDGGTLATLYLGTSQGVRQVHAREASQKAVHAVALPTYELPVKPEAWEDKAVLQIPKPEIAAIDVAGLRLERVEKSGKQGSDNHREHGGESSAAGAWRVEGRTRASVNQQSADRLAEALSTLRIGAVLGKEEQAGYGLAAPRLALSVTRRNGNTVEYRLGKMAGADDYVLKVSTRPEYFRLPGYAAKPLIEAATRKALLAAGPRETSGRR